MGDKNENKEIQNDIGQETENMFQPEQKLQQEESTTRMEQVTRDVSLSGAVHRADGDGTGQDGDADIISEGQMAAMLYDQIMGTFGEGTQLFTMEMPGRVVNQLDYAYPMEDYNSSTLAKPYAVAENEFRLTDNMLDLAPVVQGPNGNRLSSTFETVINNYTPDISNIKDFITDKMELRLFLMEEITDEIDGEVITCSRIEFCQRMYMRYLKQKYEWDQEKIDQHLKASDNDDLDGYAKWLATTSWTKDQKLENLFQDAVIRGFYHEVLTILGFLDVQSPAERLAKAKANRRSSVRRSLDASMEILPVQLQPSNWFRSLSPNFSPKDLTLDSEFLTEKYKAKRKILSSLESELRVLLLNNVDSEKLENMEAQLKNLKEQLDKAEAECFKEYTKELVEAMKLIFEIISNGDIVGFISSGKNAVMEKIGKLDGDFLKAFGLEDGQVEKLGEMMDAFYEKNIDYFREYNELMEKELEYAKAKTDNYSDQIQILKERISILSKEVAELEVIVASGAVNGESGKYQENEKDASNNTLLPGNIYNEDSEFMDIVFGRSQVEQKINQNRENTFASVSGAMGHFFSSVHASGNCSLGETEFMKSFLSSDFEIGMRATKVTIDRGGWFDEGILDLTPSYHRLKSSISGGAGLVAKDILNAYRNNPDMSNGKFAAIGQLVDSSCALPAIPMAFLIVKDIVFKANMSSVNEEDFQRFKKVLFSSSSSFMGIRVSGGGAKESFCGMHEMKEGESQFILRIPGPQILGWFQELPAKDKSGEYESLSGSEYFEGIIDSLKTYGAKLRELDNANKNKNDCITMTTIRAPREEA